MPKVSVIVPCYNMEKYVERCLDSLQKQLLEDIEIICVDDKSTDRTLEILKSRAAEDSRIHIIEQKENTGVSVARNTGIDAATGEFIAFVDADDYLDIDFYQKLYNHAIKTGAEVTKGLFTVIENGKRWITPTNTHAKRRKIRFCYDFQSAIYNREFINKHELRFMKGVALGEDITFLIKAAYLCNDLAICPYSTSYYYLIRPGSANTSMNKDKVDSVVTIVNHMINYANNAENMPKEDYDFIIWFVLDVLVKNIVKAKAEDRYLLEQSIFDVIKGAKNTKYAQAEMCNVFGQLAQRVLGKYAPNKKILKIMKRQNTAVYDMYTRQIMSERNRLWGLIKISQTPSFINTKLFRCLTVWKKHRGCAPINTTEYKVNLTESKPKVSVIVPFYNAEKHIGECMESLVNQTLKDIEIICIDDCGNDNSRQIVQKFAESDNRIKIIKNDKKRGLSYCRNIGTQHASAPYIMFCDSDGMLLNDACEKMLAAVHKNNADIAVCTTDLKYEEGQEKSPEEEYLKVKIDGVLDMNRQNQMLCNVCIPGKIYKRELIIKNKIELPIDLQHEDEFFFPAYCIWAKKITLTSEGLYVKRYKQETIMNSVSKKPGPNLNHVKIATLYMNYCKKHGMWEREKFWFWDAMFPGLFTASLHLSGPMHRKECFDYAKKIIRKNFQVKNMPPIIIQKIMSIKNARF